MREMGLQRSQKRRKRSTTDSQHGFARYLNLVADMEVTYPDQVWVSDITYIRLLREFVYLAVIMDVFTRSIRGWHLSRRLDQFLTLTALRQALRAHEPEIHHSDQGVQYAANAYVDLLHQHQVQISMAARGAPEENPYAERLIRTIKEEEVDLSEYRDFGDAFVQIGYFIDEVYQKKRIHSSLGYLTPVEYEAFYWQVHLEQMSSLSTA
jgi:transposase InsO family protein